MTELEVLMAVSELLMLFLDLIFVINCFYVKFCWWSWKGEVEGLLIELAAVVASLYIPVSCVLLNYSVLLVDYRDCCYINFSLLIIESLLWVKDCIVSWWTVTSKLLSCCSLLYLFIGSSLKDRFYSSYHFIVPFLLRNRNSQLFISLKQDFRYFRINSLFQIVTALLFLQITNFPVISFSFSVYLFASTTNKPVWVKAPTMEFVPFHFSQCYQFYSRVLAALVIHSRIIRVRFLS